jgi:drug/metabolite transporter (DMT)-like permease
MAFAVICFATNDAWTKHLTQEFAPLQVVWARYAGHSLVLLPIVALMARRRRLALTQPGLQIARGLLMMICTICATYAYAVLPLAELTALGFSGPLAATVLAIPVLGEHIGIRRWSAVLVGFVGVLIVVRPGTAAFDPAALLIVGGSCIWALGFVVTRLMATGDGAVPILIWTAAIGLVCSSVLVVPVWQTPDLWGAAQLLAMGGFNLFGQFLLIRAVVHAPASVVVPLTYTQLVWASLIGFFAFGSTPDLWTIAGAGIITASGLYVWHRERVRRG